MILLKTQKTHLAQIQNINIVEFELYLLRIEKVKNLSQIFFSYYNDLAYILEELFSLMTKAGQFYVTF